MDIFKKSDPNTQFLTHRPLSDGINAMTSNTYLFIFNFQNVVETLGDNFIPGNSVAIFVVIGGKVE